MTKRPDLVIHAGFPKCATTALQQVLFRDNAAFATNLGRVWIGRGMTAGAEGAPVSELMYDREGSLERLAAMPLNPAQSYLLSSEALAHRPWMLDALARRFDISRIILTVRLPILMALSNYCFSGWLTHAPAQAALIGQTASLADTCANLATFAPITLCPIEPPNLGSRFLSLIADTPLPDIEAQMAQLGAANPSAPPALAAALHRTLKNCLIAPVPGPLRSAFTRMAMINRGPPSFKSAMPPDFHRIFQNHAALTKELADYDTLLARHDVSDADRTATSTACRSRLTTLSELPPTDANLDTALRAHCDWFVKRIQKDTPETAPLFARSTPVHPPQ